MATIFTRIVEGEIPCYKVAESEKFVELLKIHNIVPCTSEELGIH